MRNKISEGNRGMDEYQRVFIHIINIKRFQCFFSIITNHLKRILLKTTDVQEEEEIICGQSSLFVCLLYSPVPINLQFILSSA
jgi:hypothetical protein